MAELSFDQSIEQVRLLRRVEPSYTAATELALQAKDAAVASYDAAKTASDRHKIDINRSQTVAVDALYADYDRAKTNYTFGIAIGRFALIFGDAGDVESIQQGAEMAADVINQPEPVPVFTLSRDGLNPYCSYTADNSPTLGIRTIQHRQPEITLAVDNRGFHELKRREPGSEEVLPYKLLHPSYRDFANVAITGSDTIELLGDGGINPLMEIKPSVEISSGLLIGHEAVQKVIELVANFQDNTLSRLVVDNDIFWFTRAIDISSPALSEIFRRRAVESMQNITREYLRGKYKYTIDWDGYYGTTLESGGFMRGSDELYELMVESVVNPPPTAIHSISPALPYMLTIDVALMRRTMQEFGFKPAAIKDAIVAIHRSEHFESEFQGQINMSFSNEWREARMAGTE
jgi:hypothetical protein